MRALALLRDHPEDPRNFWARRGLSTTYSSRADMTGYAAIAEETLERARRSGDTAGLCVAHMIFANLYNYTGNFAASERSVSDAARHYRADSHDGSFQFPAWTIGVQIPICRMTALSFSVDHARAQECMNEVLRLAKEQPQVALLRLGRIAEAREAIDRALAMTTSTGLSWWDSELHRIRAAVIRAAGGGDAAVREALARAVAIAEEQGSDLP